MQKNLYFRTMLRRQNTLKTILLDGFLGIATYPRLMLEIFIRRNFGQRYFSVAAVITLSIFMLLFPFIGQALSSLGSSNSNGSFWSTYASWYIFVFIFLYFAWQRSREVKLNSSIFDFSRFSLYSGDIHPFFRSLRISKNLQNVRTIETLLEPGAFVIIGLALIFLGQKLGILITLSAVVYSLSYAAAYKNGDNFIMDKIDEIIMNEELGHAFVENMGAEKTRGVRFHMQKPSSKALRQKLAEAFIEDDSTGISEPVTTAH